MIPPLHLTQPRIVSPPLLREWVDLYREGQDLAAGARDALAATARRVGGLAVSNALALQYSGGVAEARGVVGVALTGTQSTATRVCRGQFATKPVASRPGAQTTTPRNFDQRPREITDLPTTTRTPRSFLTPSRRGPTASTPWDGRAIHTTHTTDDPPPHHTHTPLTPPLHTTSRTREPGGMMSPLLFWNGGGYDRRRPWRESCRRGRSALH